MIPDDVVRRATFHGALGEPVRLAIVDELARSDRSPKELATQFALPSNLLAHHLDTLESAGLIERFDSAGDRRRRYVRLVRACLADLGVAPTRAPGRALFVCSHNSARSQLAAALWRAHTGKPASSAGTQPADHVNPDAVAAARRVGLELDATPPRLLDLDEKADILVTVCDQAHEELAPDPSWWHWSVPDPVAVGTPDAFDIALDELDTRIAAVTAQSADHNMRGAR